MESSHSLAAFVQQLLVHASIPLTLDRYSHRMPSMGKQNSSVADDVPEIMRGPT